MSEFRHASPARAPFDFAAARFCGQVSSVLPALVRLPRRFAAKLGVSAGGVLRNVCRAGEPGQ